MVLGKGGHRGAWRAEWVPQGTEKPHTLCKLLRVSLVVTQNPRARDDAGIQKGSVHPKILHRREVGTQSQVRATFERGELMGRGTVPIWRIETGPYDTCERGLLSYMDRKSQRAKNSKPVSRNVMPEIIPWSTQRIPQQGLIRWFSG